jgi:hypothetical protein
MGLVIGIKFYAIKIIGQRHWKKSILAVSNPIFLRSYKKY